MSSLTAKWITAVSICGDDNDDQHKKHGVTQGRYQLVYFTPEALVLSRSWRRVLNSCVYEEHLKALVIDEAHCVQKWLDRNQIHYNYSFCYFILTTGEKHLFRIVSSWRIKKPSAYNCVYYGIDGYSYCKASEEGYHNSWHEESNFNVCFTL